MWSEKIIKSVHLHEKYQKGYCIDNCFWIRFLLEKNGGWVNCSGLVSNHRLILCSTVFHHLCHLLGNLNKHACCQAFPDLIQLSFAALVVIIMMIMMIIKNVQFQEYPVSGNNQPTVCGFQLLFSLIVD